MNIFYLDHDPKLAVQYHVDKHVVKMILEYAQLLSTAHHMLDGKESIKDIYKSTHKNHPSAIWARQSKENYLWLYDLFINLCNEYTYRYEKIHLCESKLKDILKITPRNINNIEFTQPLQAMPDQYKNSDSIKAYRDYYIGDKKHLAKWTKREVPKWYEK